MSGLELTALGLLSSAYFDSKHRIYTDLLNVRSLAHATISFAIAERRGRLNLIDSLNYWAKKQPEHPFIVYPQPNTASLYEKSHPTDADFKVHTYTYAEVKEMVEKYSHYLYNIHKIRPNDVVALDFVNKPQFVLVWFALWNIGAVPAMINYNLQGKSLIHCVSISKAKLFIVDEEVQEFGISVSGELEKLGIPVLLADSNHFDIISREYTPMAQIKVRNLGKDPACFIFTSGTTGLPKAANFSWKKANYGSMLYGNVSFYNKSDVLYSAMPLYHSTAAALGLMAVLQKGGTYAIGHKFSTRSFWLQARLCNATAIQYVGETCRYLLNSPPNENDRNHRVTVAHGNGMRPDIWLKFKERFNIKTISEFYAATETPTAINNFQQGSFGIGACGSYGTLTSYVLKSTKWQIARIDQETADVLRSKKTGLAYAVEPNEPGEFLFKVETNNISADFQGYKGNADASNEKIIHDVFKHGDTWIRSGDLLKYDEHNNVYFVDRLGDTFRWKSENVSTNEVEEAIGEFENVDVVVCVGVKVPQHEGRAGFAVIKLHDPEKPLDMQKLGHHLLKRLPRYAVPIFIKFIYNIQSTGNNKIQKKIFREQKIPAPEGEIIWWLVGSEYKKLTGDAWAKVECGTHKL